VYKMVEMIHSRPPYVMIVGPLISVTTTAVAQVSYHWNITQVRDHDCSIMVPYRYIDGDLFLFFKLEIIMKYILFPLTIFV